MKDIYKEASRCHLRFASSKGQLTIEQLWTIPMTGSGFSLETIATDVNNNLKSSEGALDFFTKKTALSKEEQLDTLRLAIIKDIYETKDRENSAKEDALVKEQQKEKLRRLISNKEDEALASTSLEDLKKQLANL